MLLLMSATLRGDVWPATIQTDRIGGVQQMDKLDLTQYEERDGCNGWRARSTIQVF
jgi:hypothetical protein